MLQRAFATGDIVAVLAAEDFWLFRVSQPVAAHKEVISGQWLVQCQHDSNGSSWRVSDLADDVIGRQTVLADVSNFMSKKRGDDAFVLQPNAHQLLAWRERWEHEGSDEENRIPRKNLLTESTLRKMYSMCKIVPRVVSFGNTCIRSCNVQISVWCLCVDRAVFCGVDRMLTEPCLWC